jgi:hypothetical protein
MKRRLAWSLVVCACHGNSKTPPDSARSDAAAVADAAVLPACGDFNRAGNPYWGDLHTHTALSADAYEWGNRNFPHDAYAFATGTPTQIAAGAATPGPTVTIDRKLDWDAVTDHSEWLDATWACGELANGTPFNANADFNSTQCQTYRGNANGSIQNIISSAAAVIGLECNKGFESNPACRAFTASAWQVERQAAHDAYQRCTFTPLVAYEWTHGVAGATLHQNVIFGSENVPDVPFDSTEYQSPAELWTALDQACTSASGCAVLTIPHNPNLSQGMAFAVPSGVDAMTQMNRYQRLAEIHQHKGNSECYAGSAAPDPTCAFEHVPAPQGGEQVQNFVRHALAVGLFEYASSGVDPLQMGIVGATDDHNGIPGYVKEDTWQGHVGDVDDTAAQRLVNEPFHNPGGITGVWAPQNTREDIFAALYRRETFATSGPRIAVRFYQVWNATDYCSASGGGGGFPDNVIAAGGVPMGGTMPAPPAAGQKPRFVVSALADATPLAEIDIIRAQYVNGAIAEQVVRFTPASAGATFSAGSACVIFDDAAFVASGPAFYYARVLQQPTPRWSHYDCQAAPTTAGCGSGGTLDVNIQERAWTSPIWWLP